MDYLEYGGKNMNKENDFIAYLKVEYPLFCYYYDDVCNMGTTTRANLDESPSIDISRSDPERLDIYIKHAYAGGTSTKNIIHMAQQYAVTRL